MTNPDPPRNGRQLGAAALTLLTLAGSGIALSRCDDLDCVRSTREGMETSFIRDPSVWQFTTTVLIPTGSPAVTGEAGPR